MTWRAFHSIPRLSYDTILNGPVDPTAGGGFSFPAAIQAAAPQIRVPQVLRITIIPKMYPTSDLPAEQRQVSTVQLFCGENLPDRGGIVVSAIIFPGYLTSSENLKNPARIVDENYNIFITIPILYTRRTGSKGSAFYCS